MCARVTLDSEREKKERAVSSRNGPIYRWRTSDRWAFAEERETSRSIPGSTGRRERRVGLPSASLEMILREKEWFRIFAAAKLKSRSRAPGGGGETHGLPPLHTGRDESRKDLLLPRVARNHAARARSEIHKAEPSFDERERKPTDVAHRARTAKGWIAEPTACPSPRSSLAFKNNRKERT